MTEPDVPGYDIVLLAGQSNMSGRGTPFSPKTDPSDPRILQWRTHGTTGIQLAEEPLDMHDTPRGIGPAMPFARWYAARSLTPARKLLLVPTAHGGTRITVDDEWRRGPAGNLYANAIAQTLAARAAAHAAEPEGEHRIVAVLWCQGESDGDANVSGEDYRSDLDAVIRGFRTDLGVDDLPVVILTMMPEYLPIGTRAAIDAVHHDTPNRLPRTSVAIGESGAGALADGNHYDAAQQRRNGRAMYEAWAGIVEGSSTGDLTPAR